MGENSFAEGYAIGRDSNNCNYGYGGMGGFGNDWWGLIALALVFGWGGNGFGGIGGGRGAGSELFGYQLGQVATTKDVASGFSTSEIMSDLNTIQLTQANNLNFINQGFAGLNTQLLTGFHGVDNAICTLGYQNQMGFNSISREIADCCCKLERGIDGINYNMAKNTCDIITNANANTQRIIDMYTADKIEALRTENAVLKGKLSDDYQADRIIGALAPKQPIPAYPVFPTTSFAYPTGVSFGVGGNNCCGCGNGF